MTDWLEEEGTLPHTEYVLHPWLLAEEDVERHDILAAGHAAPAGTGELHLAHESDDAAGPSTVALEDPDAADVATASSRPGQPAATGGTLAIQVQLFGKLWPGSDLGLVNVGVSDADGCRMTLFYRPQDAWLADVIPFFWDGEFHLFYLKDFRDPATMGEGNAWGHVKTTDFVTFDERPDALRSGSSSAQDLYPYTGSVVEHAGVFHMFYTGHNPYFAQLGRPVQAVMHATSTDLDKWNVDPEGPVLEVDRGNYARDDWRDPHVFWNEDASEYWMLLSARSRRGMDDRQGVIALATTLDLKVWALTRPLWSPELFHIAECPDVFLMKGRWYLIYSEFSDRHATRYRVADRVEGPWLPRADDAIDGRAYYAAKTASDGRERFAFGWLATREGERDSGAWQWGGQLVTHKIEASASGALTVVQPDTVRLAFARRQATSVHAGRGQWDAGSRISCDAGDGFAWAGLGTMGDPCLLETRITFDEHVAEVGLQLRTEPGSAGHYRLRLLPGQQRVTFDRDGEADWELIDRPVRLVAGRPVQVRVLVDGSAFVAYVNDEIALSARGYDIPGGAWGLYVNSGSVLFEETSQWVR